MEWTGDVGLVGHREDIYSNPPKNAACTQSCSIGMWIISKEVAELLAIGEVVDVCWRFPGRVDCGTRMVVELSPFQFARVEKLEGQPFLDQLEDKAVGITIPAFPLYLEEREGVSDEKFPAYVLRSTDCDEIALRSGFHMEHRPSRPNRELVGEGDFGGEVTDVGRPVTFGNMVVELNQADIHVFSLDA